ncbi:MAG: hypothetical protein AAF733_03930 [Verrucomicrobiota bacterium]
MPRHTLLWIAVALGLTPLPALAETWQEKCPCGPDSVKGPFRILLLLGQGHRGADFRDACRTHDACYDTVGKSQEFCDDLFLKDLLTAAEKSRQPRFARFKAKLNHWLVVRFGKGAYDSAQKIARNKMVSDTK